MQTITRQSARTASTRPPTAVTKILVPYDFGAPAVHALEYAKELARKLGASVELLHVVTVPYVLPVTDAGLFQLPPEFVENMKTTAEAGLRDALAQGGEPARARATVRTGDPRAVILEFAAAEHVDLIVMGTRGRTGAAHVIFGSVAEHVVRTAPCPVLTVR
jgi:nucleotide-binding universal stress UspA family protein